MIWARFMPLNRRFPAVTLSVATPILSPQPIVTDAFPGWPSRLVGIFRIWCTGPPKVIDVNLGVFKIDLAGRGTESASEGKPGACFESRPC